MAFTAVNFAISVLLLTVTVWADKFLKPKLTQVDPGFNTVYVCTGATEFLCCSFSLSTITFNLLECFLKEVLPETYTVSKGSMETSLVNFTLPCACSKSKIGSFVVVCFEIGGKLPTFQASGKFFISLAVVNFKASLMYKVPMVTGIFLVYGLSLMTINN